MTRATLPTSIDDALSALGDIRWTEVPGDRNGYYRLNGRAAGTLGAGAAGAAVLGLAALPNATARVIRRAGALGTLAGASTVALALANLPTVTYTGNTNNDGQHGHPYTQPALIQNTGNAGPKKKAGGNSPGSHPVVGFSDNPHQHTFTAPLAGTATPIVLPRQTLSLFAAICLEPTLTNTWMPIDGDIKHAWTLADHAGWVLLDGRLKAALPATQQTVATTLGIGTNLPTDASVLKLRGALLSTGGSDVATVLQTHLPAISITATSDTSANTHAHTINRRDIYDGGGGPDGPSNVNGGGQPKSPNENRGTLSTDGEHIHTYTVPLGGLGTPIAVRLQSISIASFIFLGL